MCEKSNCLEGLKACKGFEEYIEAEECISKGYDAEGDPLYDCFPIQFDSVNQNIKITKSEPLSYLGDFDIFSIEKI